jgi:hypothetical protein
MQDAGIEQPRVEREKLEVESGEWRISRALSLDRAAVGRIERQLAGESGSRQDRASVGRIGRQSVGSGGSWQSSWQDRAAVGKIGR